MIDKIVGEKRNRLKSDFQNVSFILNGIIEKMVFEQEFIVDTYFKS